MSNLSRSAFQAHPFHLVSPSPWPIFTCNSLLSLTTGAVLSMHGFTHSSYWLLCALLSLVSSMFFWFKDVISEATYLGNHTLAVQRGLNMGVALFIVSGGIFTMILALIFTGFQGVEYNVSSFTISDGAFGSCFYFGTGFHGLHVMIGTAFIAVGLWRVLAYHSTDNHHLGLESSILYWHFVDVVWLFLFVSIYYWGS